MHETLILIKTNQTKLRRTPRKPPKFHFIHLVRIRYITTNKTLYLSFPIRRRHENLAEVLQSDLGSLEAWSNEWLLRFNPRKCHVLSLGKLENTRYTMRYRIYDSELEHVFEEKDLGVIIDMQLKFEEHVTAKGRIANAIVGLIRRSFSFLSCYLFRKLYIAFVRPHLEYAQSV